MRGAPHSPFSELKRRISARKAGRTGRPPAGSTTAVFAAEDGTTGAVTDRCYDRHGKAEFLDLLKLVAKTYPRRRLHVVLDNYHTHKHDDINRWLAKHPRITLHFTPTSGSWLNLVDVVVRTQTGSAHV